MHYTVHIAQLLQSALSRVCTCTGTFCLSVQNSGMGIGVVGVVKCDFLEPVHNKQNFSRTDQYTSVV